MVLCFSSEGKGWKGREKRRGRKEGGTKGPDHFRRANAEGSRPPRFLLPSLEFHRYMMSTTTSLLHNSTQHTSASLELSQKKKFEVSSGSQRSSLSFHLPIVLICMRNGKSTFFLEVFGIRLYRAGKGLQCERLRFFFQSQPHPFEKRMSRVSA